MKDELYSFLFVASIAICGFIVIVAPFVGVSALLLFASDTIAGTDYFTLKNVIVASFALFGIYALFGDDKG